METQNQLEDIYNQAGKFAAEIAIFARSHPEAAANVLSLADNLLALTRDAWAEQDEQTTLQAVTP